MGRKQQKRPANDACGATFIAQANRMLKEFCSAVGTPEKLLQLAAARRCRSLRGISMARTLFAGDKVLMAA